LVLVARAPFPCLNFLAGGGLGCLLLSLLSLSIVSQAAANYLRALSFCPI
jgi:hypothetical protein